MRKFNIDEINRNIVVTNPFPKESMANSFLDIEIGAGTGMFALGYGRDNPNRSLISIEKTSNKFRKFLNEFKKNPLSNVFPLHDNGISWVSKYLEDSTVDRYFFLYPNPNPKNKDLNKRFHAMPFMEKVIQTLKPQGEIFFATNESFYKDECIKYMTNTWSLVLNKYQEINETHCPLTLFEKKYIERGQVVYHFSFLKKTSVESK